MLTWEFPGLEKRVLDFWKCKTTANYLKPEMEQTWIEFGNGEAYEVGRQKETVAATGRRCETDTGGFTLRMHGWTLILVPSCELLRFVSFKSWSNRKEGFESDTKVEVQWKCVAAIFPTKMRNFRWNGIEWFMQETAYGVVLLMGFEKFHRGLGLGLQNFMEILIAPPKYMEIYQGFTKLVG